MKKYKLTQHQLISIKDQSGTELTNLTEIADALNSTSVLLSRKSQLHCQFAKAHKDQQTQHQIQSTWKPPLVTKWKR